MEYQNVIQKYRSECILCGILILASILLLYNLEKEGYSNSYYAACVKSMLTNPSIILFNSYDPVGFVTIDKPPVSLWIQTLSAAIFGFSGTSIILPQALAGIGSVFILYLLVQRSWGKTTGLIAAFALTITPIFIAVGRTNNMDGLLIFVLLCAVYLAVLAWKNGSPRFLITSAILIGIGFNIKMIQAFAVVPACFGIYLLNVELSWKKKILHLLLACGVLLIISISWAVMMDLTPADQRPYIGSSSENSELNLIFGYNGLNRLLGGFRPGDGERSGENNFIPNPSSGMFPGGTGENMPPGSNGSDSMPHPGGANIMNDQNTFPPGITGEFSGGTPDQNNTLTPPSPGMGNRGPQGRAGGINDGGDPGIFRMGDEGFSGQISWFLPFALIGLLTWIIRPVRPILKTGDERKVLTIALVLWLIPELVYFSFTSGFYHTYYVVMVAIPLAGLVGIGATRMYNAYTKPGLLGWLFIGALLISGIVQFIFLRYTPEFIGLLSWIILIGTIICAIILGIIRFKHKSVSNSSRKILAILSVSLLCIAPFIWSWTPVIYSYSGNMPSAGPGLDALSGQFQGMNHRPGEGNASEAYPYLFTHQSGEKYLVGVESSHAAGDLIISYGASVMAMGGYSGSDQILTDESLKKMIREGDIRYFYLGTNFDGGRGGKESDVSSLIRDSCQIIPEGKWKGNSSTSSQSVLYDCKGVF